MADQKPDNKSNDLAATQTPLPSVYTSNLPAMLDHFGISLAVSTRLARSARRVARPCAVASVRLGAGRVL